MEAPYRRIDAGGDPNVVRMRVHGVSPAELLENAAAAMWSLGYDPASISPTYSRPVVAPGDDLASLLRYWLEELLWLAREEGFVWSWFVVDRLEEGGVQGSASGLPVAEVARSGPVAVEVSRCGDPVEVPAGWWVDVDFRVDAGLRSV